MRIALATTREVDSTDMAAAQDYRAISADLFEQANIELESGDLIQASEKFWRAAAHSLRSIAEDRGWEHKSHAHFYRIIRNLANETDDKQLIYLFNAADSLHSNFYENWMQEDEIRHFSTQVSQLIHRLGNIDAA